MFQRASNGWQLAQQSWRVLQLDKEHRETTSSIDPEIEDRNEVSKQDRIPLWTK